MSKKHKKVCTTLNYNEHTFLFALLQLLEVFSFQLLVGIPIAITSSAIRLKICAITAGIKKHKSIVKV